MRTLKTFSYRTVESSYKGLNETLAELEELAGNWDNAASYWQRAAKLNSHNASREYLERLVQRANDCRKLALEEKELW